MSWTPSTPATLLATPPRSQAAFHVVAVESVPAVAVLDLLADGGSGSLSVSKRARLMVGRLRPGLARNLRHLLAQFNAGVSLAVAPTPAADERRESGRRAAGFRKT